MRSAPRIFSQGEFLASLMLLHHDELPAAMNLANVMEAHGFLRPRAAREVRKEILRRLTASSARQDLGRSQWLDAVAILEESHPGQLRESPEWAPATVK